MSNRPTIFVAVPFHYEQQRFKILRGQRWGAIDHLLLQAIVKKPVSAQGLSEASNLPKRLVVEMLIPLMKAGWLELTEVDRQFCFVSTPRGQAVATLEELPLEKEPITSVRQFIIDPCTAGCYRVGHRQQLFQLYNEKRLNEITPAKGNLIASLAFSKPYRAAHHADIFDCVSEGDEEAVAIDDTYIRISRDNIRYGLVSVDDSDRIGNAPPNLSEKLSEQILMAAQKKWEELEVLGGSSNQQQELLVVRGSEVSKTFTTLELSEDEVNLILGGDSHKRTFEGVLESARSRLVIHSTFINPSKLVSLKDKLFGLARKSVRVDILWGQVEPGESKDLQTYQDTRDSLNTLIEQAKAEGLDTLINVHVEPTGSHSKFMIFDDSIGDYSVILGSCNWLNSNFNLFEASVKVSSKSFASDMLRVSSTLSQGISRVSNLFSRELSTLANSVAKGVVQTNRKLCRKSVKVKLVLKNEHYDLVRKARDEAEADIFVCSHRFSHIAQRPVILPLITSVSNSAVEAQIYYGCTSAGFSQDSVDALSSSIGEANISFEKIALPAVHAKILAWDSNNAVITSLNWLSASAHGNDYDEIGIHLEGSGVADQVRAEFGRQTR